MQLFKKEEKATFRGAMDHKMVFQKDAALLGPLKVT